MRGPLSTELGDRRYAVAVDETGGMARPQSPATETIRAPGLTGGEIIRIVNRYIGVSGGYLADLSYRTHSEF
jgi:hypothetical protein